jgi:hypothetical protein
MVAVEKNAVVAQLDHFVFFDKSITTYNGKIFISHPVDIDLECSVVAEDLLNVIRTIDSETVTLTNEDDKLFIKSKDVSAELSTEVYEQTVLKTIEALGLRKFNWKKQGKPVPIDFINGIQQTRFTVSKDANCSFNSNCIHIIDNAIESTDRFRATEFLMQDMMEEMLIPASSANALLSIDPVQYIHTGKGNVHFKDEDGVIFSLVVMDGEFADVPSLIEKGAPEIEIKLPESITKILGNFGKLSAGGTDVFKSMEVNIQDEQVVCRTSKMGCNITKTIPFPGMKKEASFQISPVLLNHVLSKTNTIGINYSNSLASFKTANFTHVMSMPLPEEINLGEASSSTGDDVPF